MGGDRHQHLPDDADSERVDSSVSAAICGGHRELGETARSEVGQRLSISTETVRTHVRKAMNKLDADNRTQAVATALRQSLIS